VYEIHDLGAVELWVSLQRGELGPVEVTRHFLERIEAIEPQVGAFLQVDADAALERARFVEKEVPQTSPLWGIPLADKDLVQRAGTVTTFGSKAFEGVVSQASDEIVRVLDDAGSISLGKTNTPEFGLFGYTENALAEPTRNPYDLETNAGGSSGGAAAAVAARMLPFAPASDGGGSIRIPAAATGLVGIKPSRGLVPSGSGIDSLAGLAVKGPIARSVRDAAMLLDAMIGRENGRIPHPFALRAPDDDDGDLLGVAIRGEGRFNIGLLTNTPWDDAYDIVVAPEARAAVAQAVELLATFGHGIEEVTLDHGNVYPDAFRTVWRVSAATLPVDGDRIGLLEPITQELLRAGRQIGARELSQVLSVLGRFERSVIRQFARFDAVLSPSLALTPRPNGWHDQSDPARNFEQQVLYAPHTSFVNASGLPAITLPVAVTDDGQPMGVQLIGRPGGEAALISIGTQLERKLRWQNRMPALAASR